jgi:O-antigen chain-terminating methyltransferase
MGRFFDGHVRGRASMGDFRDDLYERYVSEFKSDLLLDDRALREYWRWCDAKLLPLVDGLPRAATILEIGCGPGYFLQYLAGKGFGAVRGVDISAEQVALARERGVTAEVRDVHEELRDRRGELDLIVALDVVEHFSKEENLRLFAAMRAALRPGGLILLQTPNGEALMPGPNIHGDLTHLTIFTANSLGQILRRTGFHEAAFFETGPVPKNVAGCVRLCVWRIARFIAGVVRFAECGSRQRIWTQNIICRARRAPEPAADDAR